jgi:hypothetical protein
MLLGRELGADAVHLDVDASVSGWIPLEANNVQVTRIPDGIDNTVAQGKIDIQNSLRRMFETPLRNLLQFHVLESTLVKANPHLTLEKPLSMCRQISYPL